MEDQRILHSENRCVQCPSKFRPIKDFFGAGISVASIEERIDEDRENLNVSFIRVRIFIDPFVNPG